MDDEAAVLDALSTTVTALTEDPHSLRLHKEHINLNERAGMDVNEARRLCVQYLAAPESVWVGLLESGIQKVKETFEGGDGEGTLVDEVGSVLADFQAAEKDYLSVRIRKMHMSFLISLERVGMEEDEIKTMMLDVLERAEMDMERGQVVWRMICDWQMERVEKESAPEKKSDIVGELETLHLDRLQKPHGGLAETLDSYSQFVSTYQDPGSYESKLVEASELKGASSKVYERRSKFISGLTLTSGSTGEDSDEMKGTKTDGDENIDWDSWINFEKKKVDEFVIKGVYERAIAATARRLWSLTPSSQTQAQQQQQDAAYPPLQTQLHNLRSSLASYWLSYASILRSFGRGEDRAVLARAIRSIPYSGDVWAAYMRSVESVEGAQGEDDEEEEDEEEKERVEGVFERALAVKGLLHGVSPPTDASTGSSGAVSTGLEGMGAGSGGVEDLIRVTLAKAAYERRKIEEGDEEAMGRCVMSIERGIELVRSSGVLEEKKEQDRKGKNKERDRGKKKGLGDPKLRLEFYLSDLYMTASAQPLLDMAQELWKGATAHYKSSYLAWTQYIDVLIKSNQYHEVRKIFTDLTTNQTKAFIDWPEAIWEAWMRFEALYGSLEEEEACLEIVRAARERMERKRAKDAERERLQYQQYAAAYMSSITQAPQQALTQQTNGESGSQTAAAMAMDESISGVAVDGPKTSPLLGEKRKAETEDGPSAPQKKAKIEAPPKRDREHCTLIVANVPASASEDDIHMLFSDCGPIREVKLNKLEDAVVATVEMKSNEDVPTALTKDKKKLPGSSQELSVNLGWQSTLYVTNFPEGADDPQIRGLFARHGLIFETRWPSRKFKSTRRFVYVQYAEPSAAQSALSLHGKELVPGLRLNVFISNPDRKKERTDAGADDREIYVAGLSKNTTSADLEGLFQQFGSIKEVRLATTEYGNAKGFAFVEFADEASAQKALSANNQELKGRRISVTIADSRSHAKQKGPTATGQTRRGEKIARSVRIRGLPKGAQEGLVQQMVEKYATVERVVLYENTGDAVAECSNVAEAGKLLLKATTEPVVYDGVTLHLSEESLRDSAPTSGVAKKDKAKADSAGGSGAASASSKVAEPAFIPRAAMAGKSRPRAGLGSSNRSKRAGAGAPTAMKEAPKFVSGESSQTAEASNAQTNDGQPSGLGQDAFRQMLAGKK